MIPPRDAPPVTRPLLLATAAAALALLVAIGVGRPGPATLDAAPIPSARPVALPAPSDGPMLLGRATPAPAATSADPWVEDGGVSRRDAWVPASPPPPVPQVFRHGPTFVARVSDDDVSDARSAWQVPLDDDAHQLVAYDLASLRPTVDGLDPPTPDVPTRWWRRLVEDVADAVGRDRWTDADTLLAFDADRNTLFVRQDEDGRERVEAVLAVRAAGRLSFVPLHVELEPADGTPPQSVDVDVPWGSIVEAKRSTAWPYLEDYDLDVSQCGCQLSDPILGALDIGVVVRACRIEETDDEPRLQAEILYATGEPRSERFRTSLAGCYVPIEIELPTVPHQEHARVAVRRGRRSLRLEDGSTVTLTAGRERAGPDASPVGTRSFPAADAPTRPARGPRAFRVVWEDDAFVPSCAADLVLRGSDDATASSAFQGYTIASPNEIASRAGAPDGDASAPRLGLTITTRALSLAGGHLLDLALVRAEATGVSRSVEALLPGIEYGAETTRTLHLAVRGVREDHRQVWVPEGGSAHVEVRDPDGPSYSVTFVREEPPVPR